VSLLEVRNISKHFGGLTAVNSVSFNAKDLEILGLIGPNGAGKSTLFNIISGSFPPSEGEILFEGKNLTGLRVDQITKLGIGRTFQDPILFMNSTVFENVFTAYHLRYNQPALKAFLHTRGIVEEESNIAKEALDLIQFMDLASLKDELAANIPYGCQRSLGICIALATNPKLLLLDEPVTGMNETEMIHILEKIKLLRARGISLIIVEHSMRAIMSLCDRIIVLDRGSKIAEGTPEEIRNNSEVVAAYLGKGD
jgi:branched-chain amino acid transport system ATP-binding protein